MKAFNYKTVLIAEDDQNDLVFMRMAFGQAGIPNPIQTVRDGSEAIAYLSGNGIYVDRDQYPFPTLMLLDLKMPCKDGFEVLGWWQKRGKSPDLRIIVLSGSADAGDVSRTRALGAAAYRIKNTDYASWLWLAREVRDQWLAVPGIELENVEIPFAHIEPAQIISPRRAVG
jgi:CheY-like chemotaxis protein